MRKLFGAFPGFLGIGSVITAAILLAFCPPALGEDEDERDKANFRLFDGLWQITEGPLEGFRMHFRNYKEFNLLESGGNETSFPLRKGRSAKEKRDTYRGTFFTDRTVGNDPSSRAGLARTGTYFFRLDPGGLYKLSGEFVSLGGSHIPVKANAIKLYVRRAKLVLEIEPTKRKIYEVGDFVSFKVKATLRGPSGIDNIQPTLEIAVDNAVTSIQLVKAKNINDCRAFVEKSGGFYCEFGVLGPRNVVASLVFRVQVPAELAGKRLVAAVGVIPLKNDGSYDQDYIIDASAATRIARVKIKQSSPALPGACKQLPGTWLFANGVQMIFQANGAIDWSWSLNDFTKSGTWTCVANSGSDTFKVTADYGDGFGDELTLSAVGSTLRYFPFGAFVPVEGTKTAS